MKMSDKIKGLIIFLIGGPCAALAWLAPLSRDARILTSVLLGLEATFGLLIFLKHHFKSERHLKPVNEPTAEEITGMRVKAAKQSFSRLMETDDFKKLRLHEKIYLIIHKWPLQGPNGSFNIGSLASGRISEAIMKEIREQK